MLRNISSVAGSTMVSRILGLARDMLLMTVIGPGTAGSAFILAFTLPNLFRRLLGEGALTTAIVPPLSDAMESKGKRDMFSLLNAILWRLLWVLVGITAIGIGLSLGIHLIPGLEARWYLAADLTALLFPYVISVCLAAILGVGLNVLHRYTLAALSQVWLNIAMLGALIGGAIWLREQPLTAVRLVSLSVLAGGIVQVAVVAVALNKQGWSVPRGPSVHPGLREVWLLFLPGLAGSAIFQVNAMVSRFLAFSIDESAASILYLANRLLELPLGVFAVAISTVLFPSLSRMAASQNWAGYRYEFARGCWLMLAITIPAGVGLFLLAQPILTSLFEWGAFKADDVERTLTPLRIYATVVPLYGLGMLATRSFQSRKDMRTPLRAAMTNFGVNLILGLLLMRWMGVNGLALANACAVFFQLGWLTWALAREGLLDEQVLHRRMALQVLLASTVMGLLVAAGYFGLGIWFSGKTLAWISLATLIPLGLLSYGGLLWWFRFEALPWPRLKKA